MSNANLYNRVTFSKDVDVVYKYLFHLADGLGTCDRSYYITIASNVLSANDELVILDDKDFTRLAIKGDNFGGNFNLNKPSLIIHIENRLFGTGLDFLLFSDIEYSANEVKNIIDNEYNRKSHKLNGLSYALISNALVIEVA